MSHLVGNPREEIVAQLRGQTVMLPDLERIHDRWLNKLHPQFKDLEKDVEDKILLFYPPGKLRRRMTAVSPGIFGALWFPDVTFDKLRLGTYAGMWLFAWDDEAEVNITGHNGFMQGDSYAEMTKEFIYQCVMMDKPCLDNLPGCNIPAISTFEYVSRTVCPTYTQQQKQRLLGEINYYIDNCVLEQQVQHSDTLPTVEQYIQRRLGSSAAGVLFALIEFCWDMEMPLSIMQREEMRRAWELANLVISLTNDVLSLKKEVISGHIDTLVPLLYVRHGDLQTALDVAADMITSYADEFDLQSQRLLESCSNDWDTYDKVKRFLHAYQAAINSNLRWTLNAPRYKLPTNTLRGGLQVVLDE